MIACCRILQDYNQMFTFLRFFVLLGDLFPACREWLVNCSAIVLRSDRFLGANKCMSSCPLSETEVAASMELHQSFRQNGTAASHVAFCKISVQSMEAVVSLMSCFALLHILRTVS